MALSPSQEGRGGGDKGLSQIEGDTTGGCHPSSRSGDALSPWEAVLLRPLLRVR